MQNAFKMNPVSGPPASQSREVNLQGGQAALSKQVRHPLSIRLVLPAAVILPMLMTAAAGWLSWRQSWREAELEIAHAADASAEYALRVFDGLVLRIERAGNALAGLSDEQITAREPELHEMLRRAATAGPRQDGQREPYISVYDRDAHPLASGILLPVPRGRSFGQREFNQALRNPASPTLHVSAAYVASVTDEASFTVSRRRDRTGNGLPSSSYDGVINASIYVSEAETALRRLASTRQGDVLSLIRVDGAVLARSVPVPIKARLGENSPLLEAMRTGQPSALVVALSSLDESGGQRIAAYRRVAGYPVYASAARPRAAIFRRWTTAMLPLLATGGVTTLVMSALALMVRRRQRDLATANAVLEDRVAQRTAELAESAARLRRVQHIGRVGGFEIDLRSGENFRSSEYMELHGRAAVARTEQHADWVARLHPDDRDRVEQKFLSSVSDETDIVDYAQEYRIVTPDGQTRWIAARAEVERDAAGRAVRMVGAHLDITDLKAAQTEAAEGAARLRAALRGARFGVWERHLPTASARWDVRAAEIYCGLTPDRALPSLAEWRDRIHPDDRAARLATIEGATAPGGPDNYDVEFRFRRDDGGYNWLVVHGSVVERDLVTGHGVRLAGVVQDLSEKYAADAALRTSEERLRLAQDAGGVGSWEWTIETGEVYWSESCHRLHGTDPSVPPTLETWRNGIHLDDWVAVAAGIEATLKGEAKEWATEFRFTRASDGALRWISGRGTVEREAATGRALRFRGIALDVTPQKAVEELQRLLIREIDHRAKNALAVVQAAVRLTPSHDSAAYAQAIEGRITALARAHTLLAEGRWTGADLLTLVRGELAPFLLPADGTKVLVVTVGGPEVQVSSAAAQGLAMALHELATNATKHGALSVPGGRLTVGWSVDRAAGLLALQWQEHCGPPITAPPSRRGFGTRVLEGTIKNQLGGTLQFHWNSSGLVCKMTVPLDCAIEMEGSI
ncbi:PAS domain-containing protein [Falsiroseomonas sp. HC035]|uniref:PAS domain-containing protein n=1 Tax=Falsiroseomonas sp. HC035 TaxID=3390999 RepID=UPI003D30F001